MVKKKQPARRRSRSRAVADESVASDEKASGSVEIKREVLLAMLDLTRPGLDDTSFVQIFGHFCFDGSKLHTQNDFVTVWTSCNLPLECSVEGAELFGVLKSLSDEEVTVAALASVVEFRIGTSRVKLQSLPREDFMFEMPDLSGVKKIELPPTFMSGLRHCLASTTQDLNTPELVGVTVTITKDSVNLDAFDRVVLAHYETDAKVGKKIAPFILPSEGAQAVLALASATRVTPVLYPVSDEQVVFEFANEKDGRKCWLSCLLHVTEPYDFAAELEQAIPEDLEFVGITGPLRERLKAAGVQMRHKDGARTTMTVGKKKIKITVRDNKRSVCGEYVMPIKDELDACEFVTNPEALLRYANDCDSIAFGERAVIVGRTGEDFEMLAAVMHEVDADAEAGDDAEDDED